MIIVITHQTKFIILLLVAFHTNIGWCSFTGVSVTTSLHRFPGLFSVLLENVNNAAVFMVSILLISNSLRSFSKFLESVTCVPSIY